MKVVDQVNVSKSFSQKNVIFNASWEGGACGVSMLSLMKPDNVFSVHQMGKEVFLFLSTCITHDIVWVDDDALPDSVELNDDARSMPIRCEKNRPRRISVVEPI